MGKSKVRGMAELKTHIDSYFKAPNQVIERTLSDARRRGPAWVAEAVTSVYNVKRADITGGKIGRVRVRDSGAETVEFTYSGRVLTLTHFGLSPKAPPAGSYRLKAAVIRGEPKTMRRVEKLTKKQRAGLARNFTRAGTRSSAESPIMLMGTGNTGEGGTNYIPFQRRSADRKDIEPVKTLSLPQMVGSERVLPHIGEVIDDKLGKRLEHHMKQLMG